MYMKTLHYGIISLFLLLAASTQAQDMDSTNVLDDVQADLKGVRTDKSADSLIIELFLISYRMDQREFKLNTYATQVVDQDGTPHLYASIKMGRVRVDIKDRQNYLHYLLEENVPVPLTITYGNWKGKKAKKLLLVFEDSAEEGKFITQAIDL